MFSHHSGQMSLVSQVSWVTHCFLSQADERTLLGIYLYQSSRWTAKNYLSGGAFFVNGRNLVVLSCIRLKVVPDDDELNNRLDERIKALVFCITLAT